MTGLLCWRCRTVVVQAQRSVRRAVTERDLDRLATLAAKFGGWAEAGAEASRCGGSCQVAWRAKFFALAARCWRYVDVLEPQQTLLKWGFGP